MTPTDQAQQSEDANLRKIVAQLHVNLGHPSNDALGPSDCPEDLMTQSRPRSRFDALFVNVWQSPLLFLPLHSDDGQSLENVWRLISSCLRTSLDKAVCF